MLVAGESSLPMAGLFPVILCMCACVFVFHWICIQCVLSKAMDCNLPRKEIHCEGWVFTRIEL